MNGVNALHSLSQYLFSCSEPAKRSLMCALRRRIIDSSTVIRSLLLGLCVLLGMGYGSAYAQATLVADYRFDDVAWCSPASALDSVGGHHGTLISSVGWQDSPVSGGKPVNGAAASFSSGAIDITGLPLNLAPGASNSVSFWMYWDGTDNGMPLGFGLHDLWLRSGSFGFNTFNSDVYGISSAGLAGAWHHVAAEFINGSVNTNKLWIDGIPQALTQRLATPNVTNAVVSSHLRLSGVWGNSGYLFGGALDVVRIYSGLLTQAQVDSDRALSSPAVSCPPPPPPTVVAHYRLDDAWEVSYVTVNAVAGGTAGNFTMAYPAKIAASTAAPNKPNTCSAASLTTASGPMRSSSNALDLNLGGKNSVSFWMYWNGVNGQMPFGFNRYDLWLQGGAFGFNSGNSDVYGISSAGLANGWHHVAAVFTNGNIVGNKLWIDGVPQILSQQHASPNNSVAYASNAFQFSGWGSDAGYRFDGRLDELKVYRGVLTDAMVLADYTDICVVADWRMDESAWNGSANEVFDSGGGQFHGTARIAAGATPPPTTASVSPARRNGGESTCSYGEFDNTTAPIHTYSYVELPSFPALPSSFTFGAWIRSTNASAQHQRILVRDDANDGWGLSLADGTGQPELRFFNRNITNAGTVTGQGRNPSCGVFCLDTDPVLTSNTWYYIASAIDTVGKTVTLYVFNATGALLAETTSAFAGTWKDGTGLVTIGGESDASSEGRQSSWHFLGNIDELRIFSGVLSRTDISSMLARTRTCVGLAVTPANFNCVTSGTDSLTGHLYTQRVGSGFAFDIVALKTNGSVENTYASDGDKTVTVELVNGAGATACTSRVPISPAVSQSLVFAKVSQPIEQGRKPTTSMTVNKAYADLRCRVTDASQSPSIVGCSVDNFAVRPSGFAVASSANADGSGTNVTATPAAKTGSSFSLTAVSGAAGYDAIPRVDLSLVAAHPGAPQIGTLSGSFGNADPLTGSATGNFAYTEVGYFNLTANAVYDDAFTAVDAAAGDCTADFSNTVVGGRVGCKFGNAAASSYFGRFIPDHFVVASPSFTAACSAGNFSYMDQTFALSAKVEARNSNGLVTKNYNGAFAKGVVSVQMENANSGVPIDSTRLTGLVTPGWVLGQYAFSANQFARVAMPDGPYDLLDLGLGVVDETGLAANARPYQMVRDMDASSTTCTVDLSGLSTAAGLCTATRVVNATKLRYGRLWLGNAYGSERQNLSLPYETQYWNGFAFIKNTLDSCTALTAANVGIGNYQGSVSAANLPTSSVSLGAFSAGAGSIRLTAPSAAGSGDVRLALGSTGTPAACAGLSTGTAASMAYLSGKWCGLSYDRDPVARATFGINTIGRQIYLREGY